MPAQLISGHGAGGGNDEMIVFIACVAGLSGLLIGYNTAVIAGALDFLTQDFQLGPVMQGVVVSSVLLGGFVGSLVAGGLIRRLGERPVLFATALLFVVGAIGSGLADSIAWLLVWRTVTGLGVGAATMVTPLYVGETAPASARGALVSVIQLAITVGILISYLTGAAWTPSRSWQAMLLVGAIPGLLMLAGLVFVPESPRWYLLRGRRADAERAHRRLTGGRGEALPPATDDVQNGDWRNLLQDRNRMVLILAAGLFAFANLSGIDAILYYAPVIFAYVGFGGTLGPILATVGIGTVNVAATIVAMVLIDRLGRRPLLIGGLVVMALSLIVLAAALMGGQSAGWSNILAVTCLSVFVVAFGVSLGPLPYVMMSELFPLALRGAGMGIASATAWAVNVLVSLTFPIMVEAMGIALVFGLYGLVSVAALAFVIALAPETRGRSLELIEANLARGRSVRDLGLALPANGRNN
ncbi:MAG TPA: sugar porter family MFS transporter [Reyranella sp.]|nr:sugar porter family MFS transporter [Reyranella sp.]